MLQMWEAEWMEQRHICLREREGEGEERQNKQPAFAPELTKFDLQWISSHCPVKLCPHSVLWHKFTPHTSFQNNYATFLPITTQSFVQFFKNCNCV
jgi:hypothetical protein